MIVELAFDDNFNSLLLSCTIKVQRGAVNLETQYNNKMTSMILYGRIN